MAVDMTECVKDASSWCEWEDTEVTERKEEQESKRIVQEERWLWKRLEESDRKQAKEERYNNLKKSRKIAKAREKMKVGKEQPGIMDKLRRAVPVSHVQGGAANEPGVRCQGDGDIQPGNSQAHEVQPDQQECQDDPQEPDDQDHVPRAREGHEGAHQGVQQDDGDGQSSKYQGDARQDGGDGEYGADSMCKIP